MARVCFTSKALGSLTAKQALTDILGSEEYYQVLRARYDQESLAQTFVAHDQELKEKKSN